MRERVLLTGASGLVGRAVVRRLVESGWQVRALVHADDSAAALASATAGRGHGGTFHVAGAPRASFRGALELAAETLDVEPRWREGPADAFLPLVWEAATVPLSLSIERAREHLEYEPRCDWRVELRSALGGP